MALKLLHIRKFTLGVVNFFFTIRMKIQTMYYKYASDKNKTDIFNAEKP